MEFIGFIDWVEFIGDGNTPDILPGEQLLQWDSETGTPVNLAWDDENGVQTLLTWSE